MFIKFGTYIILLGVEDASPFQCPQCKELTTTEFIITGEYYHFYYIPIFPIGKDGYSRCSNCTSSIRSLKFNKKTSDQFKEISSRYKYPLHTYTGITIIVLPFIILLLSLLISAFK
jgi:hypothetical protein